MSAAPLAASGAPVDRPRADPVPVLETTLTSAARLEAARQREHEAARRLAEAIRRCEQAHARAVLRLEALDALLESTKAAVRRHGFSLSPALDRSPR